MTFVQVLTKFFLCVPFDPSASSGHRFAQDRRCAFVVNTHSQFTSCSNVSDTSIIQKCRQDLSTINSQYLQNPEIFIDILDRHRTNLLRVGFSPQRHEEHKEKLPKNPLCPLCLCGEINPEIEPQRHKEHKGIFFQKGFSLCPLCLCGEKTRHV